MGTKRSISDVEAEDPQAGSPTPDAGSHGRPKPSFKRQRQNGKSKHKAKEGTIEYAKKRARTIERLFQRNQDLPANVRNDLERELAAHKATVNDKSFQKKRSAMISKYHMVRFFERKKSMRLAKQLRKKIDQCDDAKELEALRHNLHVAEVDQAYAVNFPHTEVYISIYAKPKGGSGSAEGEEEGEDAKETAKALLESERPSMWKVIEKAMEEGPEALKRIRERRSGDDSSSASTARPQRGPTRSKDSIKKPAIPEPATKTREARDTASSKGKGAEKPALNRRERRRLMREMGPAANESEDDGEGFFENA